jgi:hypothetical protein
MLSTFLILIRTVFVFSFLGWSGTEPTITEVTAGLLYQPRMMDDVECGAVGIMTGRRNRSTGSNPAAVPLVLHKFHMT